MAGGEGKRGSSGKAFVVAGMVVAAPLLTVVVVSVGTSAPLPTATASRVSVESGTWCTR